MVQVHAASSENLGVITVRGNLTNRIVADLRAAVDQALRRFSRVILSFEKAATIDRECLQFLCMAHCIASEAHKSLVVAGARAVHPDKCSGCAYSADPGCFAKYRG
ncbi:MAG: STAS domain-containing protein [Nitrospirota bacterium]